MKEHMKYWRVIRHYFQRKYSLNISELELFLFLYSEGYFTRKVFNEFAFLYTWDRSIFADLTSRGFISTFTKDKKREVYCLSRRGIYIVKQIYKVLDGEMILPQEDECDPSKGYVANKYRKMIIRMNNEGRANNKVQINKPLPPY